MFLISDARTIFQELKTNLGTPGVCICVEMDVTLWGAWSWEWFQFEMQWMK